MKPRVYVYDGNGNPTSYSEEKSFRKMTWDEENRLMGINDNGRIHQYTYDAGGERVIKSSGDSQNVAINGQTAATIVHSDDYTGYVSPYFVISKGKFTKHYFEGAGRIVSKLGNGAFAQPLKITADGVNYSQLTAEQQKALDNYVKSLGVPPGPPTQQGIYATPEFTGDPYPSEVLQPVGENQEPPEGWPRNPIFNAPGDVPGPPVQFGPPLNPETVQAAEGFTGIGLPENDIFYFHPDHLGSTSYITTRNGSISQHVEYIAFGEILFEEHSSSFSSPYLFNGKELDRETNLSYYGARYLDMKTSLWLNVDPLALYNPIFEDEFYFDGQHNGGIYNSGNLSNYNYCYQNPIKYVDPNGKQSVAGTLIGVAKRGITATILYMAYPNCGGDCKSLFKSNYIGPSSSALSAKDQRKTQGLEPVDEVDLAAFNHDVSYDKIKAAGVKGAVIDLATLPADIKLLSDAKKTAEKYSNGSIDDVTGDKVSLVTWARADAVITAFEPLISEKKARIYASEQAKKAKENIKLTIENAEKSLTNPTVW